MVARARARDTRGFTLLEMVIVVAILLLLAGIALPLVASEMERERREATRLEMRNLAAAIEALFTDTLTLPANLDALVFRPGKMAGWCGPYVSPGSGGDDGHRLDAWDRPYDLTRQGPSLMGLLSKADEVDDESDDLVQEIDLTPARRKITRDRLDVVGTAINRYLRDDINEMPAPTVAELIDRLVGYGYLPSDSDWRIDAWGDAFVPDPIGGRPIVRVTSIHFQPGTGETSGSGTLPDDGGRPEDGGGGGDGDDDGSGGDDDGAQHPPGFSRGNGTWK